MVDWTCSPPLPWVLPVREWRSPCLPRHALHPRERRWPCHFPLRYWLPEEREFIFTISRVDESSRIILRNQRFLKKSEPERLTLSTLKVNAVIQRTKVSFNELRVVRYSVGWIVPTLLLSRTLCCPAASTSGAMTSQNLLSSLMAIMSLPGHILNWMAEPRKESSSQESHPSTLW